MTAQRPAVKRRQAGGITPRPRTAKPRRGAFAAEGDDHAATYLQTAGAGSQHAVRHVFRRGEPDLPCIHGPVGGPESLAGVGGLPDHRRGPAAAGRGGAGHQPGGRASPAQQPGGPRVRPVFHLPAVPDHRPVLRHSPLRDRVLYGGHPAAGPGRMAGRHAGGLFAGFLRGGAVLLAAARPDPDLDRQAAQPAVPLLPGGAGDPGADCAAGPGVGRGTGGQLYIGGVLHRPAGRL